ncbi:MAG: iron ABC transporter permease [Candidatus Hydrogenedentes bacterium]|nr:iron ABC transporter permease [Candidatus Hydrogenedentota bacterium]
MKRATLSILIVAGSLATLMCAPLVGGRDIPLTAVFQPGSDDAASVIFWQIRLPRACLAWTAGAGLAAAGMVFQALFRNPLATPFTLGVASGASFGAAVGVRLGLGAAFLGLSAVSFCAMAGALLAIGVVYGLTVLKRDCSIGGMLLAGVAVNFFFSSAILLIQYTADFHDTFRILRWLMGALQMVGFDAPLCVLPFVAAGALLMAVLVGELNLLSVGEDLAASRGVAVGRVKALLFFSISMMVGVIVSVCGPIGFVGLMCPHICRLIVGADHRRLLPAAILFGGAFLVACDTLARTAFAPTELPVGIFTAFLGGPFFLWLLLKPPKGAKVAA